jgi:predicted alpha/beta superfamily hydrolase
MKTRFVLLTVFSCILINVSGQSNYNLKQDSLQSGILNQNRKLSIYLPDGYDTANVKFPVIYVLDGEGRCQHIVPTTRFLFENNKMPKVIVVGIHNIDRNHDFLPDSTKSVPTSGGADKFITFFKDELIPYIDKTYKTEPYKVLIGHSFGGLFTMYALLKEPDLFDSYIAMDPSFWYKDRMLVKIAKEELAKPGNWSKSIFITGREGEGMVSMGIPPMQKQLETSAPKELNWKLAAYPQENHGSVTFKSAYDGLCFIFDGGSNIVVYPDAGILPKGKSTYVMIENNNPDLRYTIDGTEPTINSLQCKDMIKITKACTLKVKCVAKKYKPAPAITRIFSEGGYLSAQQSAENLKPGLNYSYYEGAWDSIPDFSELTAKKTGVTNNLDFNFALRRDSFAVQFEGYLHVTKKDLYDLWITSDDGSQVYFNNQMLLNNNGIHSSDKAVVKLVPLTPGYYPFKILYFEKTGNEGISFGSLVVDKKANPTPVPAEMLFHKE